MVSGGENYGLTCFLFRGGGGGIGERGGGDIKVGIRVYVCVFVCVCVCGAPLAWFVCRRGD